MVITRASQELDEEMLGFKRQYKLKQQNLGVFCIVAGLPQGLLLIKLFLIQTCLLSLVDVLVLFHI